MVGALNSYAQGLSAQNYASRTAIEADAGKSKPSQKQAATSNGAVTDTVEISTEALVLSQAQEAKPTPADPRVAYYQQFRPTHEGFSSYNMTLGIVDPSTQPFSQNRAFADVAQAARESLDNNYQKLKDMGKSYDYTYARSEDQNSLFGELDRRALYAVASNEGGLFTEDEQSQARDIMRGQQGMAMGLYNGPTALAGKFAAIPPTSNNDHARVYKAGITFLDSIGTEEKANDFEWAMQRATVQFGYENATGTKGTSGLDSDSPLVKLIKAALDNAWRYEGMENLDNMDFANLHNADDLKSRTWFESYADRLDSAIAEHRKIYGTATA